MPNGESAEISEAKIVDYLLCIDHPDGQSKARFFRSLGFDPSEWRSFAGALKDVVTTFDVVRTTESKHGVKYVVDGMIEAPSGGQRGVRTVWILEWGQWNPRLVTAYACDGVES